MWIIVVASATQPAFTLPFIHSPSRGNGCLGRLPWPWGAWLSLWSLLPGTDCPPAHLDPNLCYPTPQAPCLLPSLAKTPPMGWGSKD